MESFLQEIRRRGTLLFPLQHYEMYNETGHLFVSAHWHREIELICQIRGTAVLTVEGTVYDMNPGDIYFINSGFIHQFQSHDPESFYYAYVFPLDSLAFIQEDYSQKFYLSPLTEGTLLFPVHISPGTAVHSFLYGCIQTLIDKNKEQDTGYQLYTKALLYLIISRLYEEDLFVSRNTGLPGSAMDKAILSYLEEHYSEKVYLEDIAGYFHMSPKYFCRYFKKHFGKTMVEYLTYLRIEKACGMLLSSSQSVLNIALATGFSNISYFNKCFKGITGMTPKAFRTTHKDKKKDAAAP